LEGVEVGPDAGPGRGQVVVVEIQVQEVDVPGNLVAIGHVGGDDLPRDRQGGRLRIVVDVAVPRAEQLFVLLGEQAAEERRVEAVAGAGAGRRVVGGKPGA